MCGCDVFYSVAHFVLPTKFSLGPVMVRQNPIRLSWENSLRHMTEWFGDCAALDVPSSGRIWAALHKLRLNGRPAQAHPTSLFFRPSRCGCTTKMTILTAKRIAINSICSTEQPQVTSSQINQLRGPQPMPVFRNLGARPMQNRDFLSKSPLGTRFLRAIFWLTGGPNVINAIFPVRAHSYRHGNAVSIRRSNFSATPVFTDGFCSFILWDCGHCNSRRSNFSAIDYFISRADRNSWCDKIAERRLRAKNVSFGH